MIVSALLNKHVPMLRTKGDSLSVGCNDPSLDWQLQPGSLRDMLSKRTKSLIGAANGELTSHDISNDANVQDTISRCASITATH
jgi:hypothetical protein